MWKIFSKLSILALAIGAVVGLMHGSKIVLGGANAGKERAIASPPIAGGASGEQAGTAHGDVLLDSAIATIEARESVSARLRVQIDMFGQQLFGNGKYLQKGRGEAPRYRWEMTIQSTAGKSSMAQVSDGRRLWLHEDVTGRKKLRFVDLAAMRKAAQGTTPRATPTPPQPLALGGLHGMLHRLQKNFQFGPAQRTEWNGLSMWITRGVWREEQRDLLLASESRVQSPESRGSKSTDGEKPPKRPAPSRLPSEVVLFINAQTLFPHRVEYHHGANANRSATSDKSGPFFALELLEVQFDVTIGDTRFTRPSNLPSTDVTGRYLRQLGLDDGVSVSGGKSTR